MYVIICYEFKIKFVHVHNFISDWCIFFILVLFGNNIYYNNVFSGSPNGQHDVL